MNPAFRCRDVKLSNATGLPTLEAISISINGSQNSIGSPGSCIQTTFLCTIFFSGTNPTTQGSIARSCPMVNHSPLEDHLTLCLHLKLNQVMFFIKGESFHIRLEIFPGFEIFCYPFQREQPIYAPHEDISLLLLHPQLPHSFYGEVKHLGKIFLQVFHLSHRHPVFHPLGLPRHPLGSSSPRSLFWDTLPR